MIRFRKYRPRAGACFFTGAEIDAHWQGVLDKEAGKLAAPPSNKREAHAYRLGFGKAVSPKPRGRKLPPLGPDLPRKLCAWTRANDAKVRAAMDAGRGQEGPHVTFEQSDAAHRAQATITATSKGLNMPSTHTDDAARKSEAARRAWATRRAQGWTHPATGNSASAKPAPDPIKRASLAQIAAGSAAPVLESATRKRAAEISAAPKAPKAPPPKPEAKPRRKVRNTPARKPAKKAPAKKTKAAARSR